MTTKVKSSRPLYAFKPEKVSLLTIGSKHVPLPRSGHSSASDETVLYIFGGYNPLFEDGKEGFKELWRLNAASMKWDQFVVDGSFPEQTLSSVAFFSGGELFVHGGTGIPFGTSLSSSLYTVGINEFVAKFDEAWKGHPAYGHSAVPQSCVSEPGQFGAYLFGGTAGHQFKNELIALSKIRGKIEGKEFAYSMVSERYKQTMAVYKDEVIVFGGSKPPDVHELDVLQYFSLKRKVWSNVKTLPDKRTRKFPVKRYCHAGVQLPWDDKLYIICGGNDGENVLNDVWSYNMSTKQWKLWDTSLPTPIHFHCANVLPSGQMLVFGGLIPDGDKSNRTGTKRTNQVLSCWLKIPRLTVIAWQACLHYNPGISNMPLSQLLRAKFPAKFLRQIKF